MNLPGGRRRGARRRRARARADACAARSTSSSRTSRADRRSGPNASRMLLDIDGEHPQVVLLAEHSPRRSARLVTPRVPCARPAEHVERVVEALDALAPVVKVLRVARAVALHAGVAAAAFAVDRVAARARERVEVVVEAGPSARARGACRRRRRALAGSAIASSAGSVWPRARACESRRCPRARALSGWRALNRTSVASRTIRVARPRQTPSRRRAARR